MSQSLPLLPALVKERAGPLACTDPLPGGGGSSSSSPKKEGVSLPTVKSDSNLKVVNFAQNNEVRFKDFLSRQSNSCQEVRLELAKYQRDELAKMRAESASGKFVGSTHFKMMLQHRFGTITAAWRQLLDPASNGKVSFADFCQCCRDLGYNRRMKQLWAELDTEQNGFISLDNIDPVAAHLVKDFRRDCRLHYGGMLQAWHAFDLNKNHRLDLPEFEKCCADVKFRGSAAHLFTCLKSDVCRKYLTIQDFDEKSMQCLFRGDEKMMTVRSSLTGPESDKMGTTMPSLTKLTEEDVSPASGSGFSPASRTQRADGDNSNTRWINQCSQEQIRIRDETKRKNADLDQGMKCLTGLKRQLIVSFGSLYAAWRQVLDMDGNNRLSFGEFCLALRNMGYGGNMKDLFAVLDRDGDGFINLRDLDERTYEEVTSYKKLALEKYSNLLTTWREAVDPRNSGQVDEVLFARHCRELGWSGSVKSLFNNLKEDRSRKFLTLRDYDIKAYKANNRGDLEMLSEESKDPKAQKKRLTFHQRQGNCFSQRWSRMRAKSDLADLAQSKQEEKAKDQGAGDADSLRMQLVRKYGTMTAAWKHALDIYHIGKLPFAEFCIVMRRLGFNGDIKHTFNQLDTAKKGNVTLKDMDEEANEYVTEFRTTLLDKYGTYLKAWQAVDASQYRKSPGNGSLEVDEVVALCESIGFKKEPQKLFKYLLDGPGKRLITMADLDPAAMQAHFRGDLEGMSPMEKARAGLAARKKAEQEAKAKSMEAHDWPSLKKSLIRRYGTIISAWREGLDVGGNGKVSFSEFSKQIRNLGFTGDIKEVFQQLDDDASGIISFNEIDSGWYQRLAKFNDLLLKRYLSYEGAWYAMDENHNNMVELDEFIVLCAELGYKGNAKALFRQLLKNPLRKHLSLEDMESNAAIIQGNKEDALAQGNFYMHKDSMLSDTEKAQRDLQERKAQKVLQRSKNAGADTWDSLKDMLIRKYGSITAAWRQALDISGDGRLSKTEFFAACRNNGFQGNTGQAFKELDVNGSGIVSFEEVDGDWFTKLTQFQDLLLQKHETYEKAWKVLNANNSGQPGLEEIANVCTSIGYTHDPKSLFKQLLDNPTRRFLTPEGLDCSTALGKDHSGGSKGPVKALGPPI